MLRNMVSSAVVLLCINLLFAIGIILPRDIDVGGITVNELPVLPVEAKLKINIIDNYVTLDVMQIFRNPNKWVEEGVLNFPLQEGMEVFAFSTWDGPQRIPGQIMEKRRAIRIYEELRARAIDPGILLPSARNLFTAKIVPIPAYGTKRLEITTGGLLQEIDGTVRYSLPLAAEGALNSLELQRLDISVNIDGRADFEKISIAGIDIPLIKNGSKASGTIELSNFVLPEALNVEYSYKKDAPELSVLLVPDGDSAFGLALFSPKHVQQKVEKPAIAVLIDISASMNNYFDDVFSGAQVAAQNARKYFCLAFNDSLKRIPQDSWSNDPKQIEILKNNVEPGWGTNLLSALEKTYAEISPEKKDKAIVLLTDGVPSVGEIGHSAILSLVEKNKDIPIHIVAVGADISAELLQSISEKTNGAFIQIAEGEDISSTLERRLVPFLTRNSVQVAKFEIDNAKLLSAYPEHALFYGGIQGAISFILNKIPQKANATIVTSDGKTYQAMISEPKKYEFVPRMWARQRVDYLLRLIAEQGEKDEWVNEIIALSKRFTFVTSYTAFLAAPRAVLRPRSIQPMDPKLVIEAPNAIQVIVDLPWGEQIIAIQNEQTSLWEARFIVPQYVTEGEYECIITLTDATGAQWQQRQKFVVDVTPPQIKAEIIPNKAKTGQTVEFRVYAPQDTRTIYAKTPDGKNLELRYDGSVSASVAKWMVPTKISHGEYTVKFTATDFAGNQSETEVKFEIE